MQMMPPVDIQGHRFGRLLVTDRSGTNANKRATWNCVCDCRTVTVVSGKDLRSGNTKSCGCLMRERQQLNGKKNSIHGHSTKRTRTYETWLSMHQRCNQASHKSFHHYGGRGIKVCVEWDDFTTFISDMGERPMDSTIDRIDSNGNYEPSNCRWATSKLQQRNRSSNVVLEAFGERKLIVEWTEDDRCVVSPSAFEKRLSSGWEIERALVTPKYANRGGQ